LPGFAARPSSSRRSASSLDGIRITSLMALFLHKSYEHADKMFFQSLAILNFDKKLSKNINFGVDFLSDAIMMELSINDN
jgi:hypothetical protein